MSVIATSTTWILIVLMLIVELWLLIKTAFIFVEIAFGRLISVRRGWGETKGHVIRLTGILFGVFGVMILPFIVFGVALALIGFGEPESAALFEGFAVLVGVIIVCLHSIRVSATSIAYRHVTGWSPIGPEGPISQETSQ